MKAIWIYILFTIGVASGYAFKHYDNDAIYFFFEAVVQAYLFMWLKGRNLKHFDYDVALNFMAGAMVFRLFDEWRGITTDYCWVTLFCYPLIWYVSYRIELKKRKNGKQKNPYIS